MKKIFISHSSKDQEIVGELINFLMAGMGVAKEGIYCTSMSGLPTPGRNFMEEIKRELKNAAAFLIVFTENYLKSQMCLMEQGIAWYLSEEEDRTLYLMRAGGITLEKMREMPLRDTQSYALFEQQGLYSLYDGLCRQGIARQDTPVFLEHAGKFLNCHQISGGGVKGAGTATAMAGMNVPGGVAAAGGIRMIQPDPSGFYTVRIRKVRGVPHPFRCYLIDGLVRIPKEQRVPGETHWLFYRDRMYPELHEGDLVRFKFDQTELRDFADLKRARNIYPTRLELLS